MATRKRNDTGLPPELPKAPGNAKAGQPPPRHVIAAEREIPYLARDKQRWTQSKINATFGKQAPPKTGVPDLSDLPPGPQLPTIPPYRIG
jgi:hypothetical protein